MSILDDAMRWGRDAGSSVMDKTKKMAGSMSPTGEAYESASRSKLGRAAGAVGAGIHGVAATDAFSKGDPYKLAGHGLMTGLDTFAPTRPIALAADALTGGKAADMVGTGLRKADEFMANTFDNERAKTRLGMAGPQQAEQPAAPAAAPTAAPAATPDAPAGAKQPAPQAGGAPAAMSPATLGSARRELPQLPKFDFAAPEGDRTGFGLAMKLMAQQPQALQYARDAKNQRFGFEQDKHADDVALKNRQLDIEQAKNNAAIEANKNAKVAQQTQHAQELDDKRMKQFMDDTSVHNISHTDPKTGKTSQIADDVKNNDFRNFIRQHQGSSLYDSLTSQKASDRQAAIQQFKQMFDVRDKVNTYAAERGGVTTSGPVGLGRARDYSFSRDVLNPGGVGAWTYFKNGGFLDRANNPQVVDTTIPRQKIVGGKPAFRPDGTPDMEAVTGQSMPLKELIGTDGTVNADYINLLNQSGISLSNARR